MDLIRFKLLSYDHLSHQILFPAGAYRRHLTPLASSSGEFLTCKILSTRVTTSSAFLFVGIKMIKRFCESDYIRLTQIATSALDKLPEVAEKLLADLRQGDVRPEHDFPDNVVRIGSIVEFEMEGHPAHRTITLVFPGSEDIRESRVSVMTPVGATLVGLRVGQEVYSTCRDGRNLRLLVLSTRTDDLVE